MPFFKNLNPYPVLVPTAAGNNITLQSGKGVEGSYFSRFRHLTQVDSLPEGDDIMTQTRWEERGKEYLTAVQGRKFPSPAAKVVPPTPAPVKAPAPPPVVEPEPVVEAEGFKEPTRAYLVTQATKLGVAGAYAMKKADLIEAIKAIQGE
jgi:hypothetical protein